MGLCVVGIEVSALRQRYGDTQFEYWNAGVESFSMVQEVATIAVTAPPCVQTTSS